MSATRLVALATACLCLVGCSSGSERRATPDRPQRLRLDASVTQFRFDEGTRNLKAGVTNNGTGAVRVSQATIVWGGFAFPTIPIGGGPVPPGQTAAFTIAYGAPQCSQPPTGRPTLLAVVDGRTRRLPLRVEDPQLLVRLHAKECARERLDAAASVELRLGTRTEEVRGEEYLPGDLLLRHRPGSTARVGVVDLGGSVLIDLVPRDGRKALPGQLPPRTDSLSFPVLLGSAHRCDAHARGQSSQTFLISAYVRLADEPTQRVTLPLTTDERDLLLGVIDRDCG